MTEPHYRPVGLTQLYTLPPPNGPRLAVVKYLSVASTPSLSTRMIVTFRVLSSSELISDIRWHFDESGPL